MLAEWNARAPLLFSSAITLLLLYSLWLMYSRIKQFPQSFPVLAENSYVLCWEYQTNHRWMRDLIFLLLELTAITIQSNTYYSTILLVVSMHYLSFNSSTAIILIIVAGIISRHYCEHMSYLALLLLLEADDNNQIFN